MKKINEYQQAIDQGFYEHMPKAVLAAIAVSFAEKINSNTFETFDGPTFALQAEWATLHANGIVPQKPYEA